MTASFGMHVRFTAQPGQGDARAMPLIAGRPEATGLLPAGGKGL